MKYLIVDLDQTLLNNSSSLTLYTINGINKLKELGFLIVFNTARSFQAQEEYFDIIKPDYTIINGGVAIYNQNKEIVYSSLIDVNTTNDIIESFVNDKDILNFSIQTSKTLYSGSMSYCQLHPNLTTYHNFNTPLNLESEKIVFESLNKEKHKRLANKYNLTFTYYLGGSWCRVSKATKESGNLALFKLLNDDKPQDYTFGDDLGDLNMIKNAYHGVILKNAKEEFKTGLNVTLYDNDNDGVIKYMEGIINEY